MLNSPAISELALESSTFNLFNEFLKGFFDGAAHVVGYNAPVAFPTAEIHFQQSSQTAPLNGAAISLVWISGSRPNYHWETVAGKTQRMATVRANWMFFVRAQKPDDGTGNAKALAMRTGELLFALLQNSTAVKPLAQKGIHRLRPSTPQLLSEGAGAKSGDPAYAMRGIACAGTLRYAVISQPV